MYMGDYDRPADRWTITSPHEDYHDVCMSSRTIFQYDLSASEQHTKTEFSHEKSRVVESS
jgi:hypothetical protein